MNKWQIATLVLGAVVVGQFFWWNAKAPEVLNLGWGTPRTPPPLPPST